MKKILPIIVGIAVCILIISIIYSYKTEEGERISRSQISEYKYVASALREPFHYPTCRWAKKISPENLIAFKSRQEALDSGRRPCKVCRP